jgi:hypothetical protein
MRTLRQGYRHHGRQDTEDRPQRRRSAQYQVRGIFKYFFKVHYWTLLHLPPSSDFTVSEDDGIEPRTVANIRHWLTNSALVYEPK